jgi:hypothetical protein
MHEPEARAEADAILRDVDEFTTAAADAEGVTADAWSEARVREGAASLVSVANAAADEAGASRDEFATGLLNFSADAAAFSAETGVSEDAYAFALGEAIDATRDEMATSAAEVGLDGPEYLQVAACIARGAAQKAVALEMSISEYERYAWTAVKEARQRNIA